jgi:hypothetical protein
MTQKKNQPMTWLLQLVIIAGLSSQACAATLYAGSVEWLENSSNAEVGVTIDRIDFLVATDSEVIIDVASLGVLSNGMDTQIRLALDDGSIEPLDFFADNDDGPAGTDGSIYYTDSYLSFIDDGTPFALTQLDAGNYSLFISGCCFTGSEALEGGKVISGTETVAQLNTGALYGNYQVTIDIQPTVVPVPAAFWLFGSALLGLVGIKQRR